MSKGQHKGGVVCTVQSVDIQLFSYLHIWSHVHWVQNLRNSEIINMDFVGTMLAKIQNWIKPSCASLGQLRSGVAFWPKKYDFS